MPETQDPFKGHSKTLDSVADKAKVITPSDTEELSVFTRAVYVGTGGDLQVILVGDTDPITLKNLSDGSLLPLRVKKVLVTGTTASDLVALL